MCSALGDVRFVPIADIRELKCAKKKDRLAVVSPKFDQVSFQAARAAAFCFLRRETNTFGSYRRSA